MVRGLLIHLGIGPAIGLFLLVAFKDAGGILRIRCAAVHAELWFNDE